MMGFASLYPSYKKTRLRILAARGARRDAIGDALQATRPIVASNRVISITA